MNSESNTPHLLLESEAADLLRCSVSSVKRLRLNRKLGYYTGRPVLISQADLELYVASAKVLRVRMPGTKPEFALLPVHSDPGPFKLLTRAEAARLFRRSPLTIKNWCMFGKVPFLPGKPARVDEKDISDFILSKQYRTDARSQPEPGSPEFLLKERADVVAEIRHRARVQTVEAKNAPHFAGALRAHQEEDRPLISER